MELHRFCIYTSICNLWNQNCFILIQKLFPEREQVSNGPGNGLAQNWQQQSITWTNDDHESYTFFYSLGHNELGQHSTQIQ